jgi:hypothetical protein
VPARRVASPVAWCDTKAAIILFVKNKNFSAVLDKIVPVVEAHPNHEKTVAIRDLDPTMPVDPDFDDLPPEPRERPGPFRISGVDRETSERFEGSVSRNDLARGFADARRRREG